MTGRGIGYLIFFALALLAGLATGFREIFLVVFCLFFVLLYCLLTALWGALTLRTGRAFPALTAVRESSVRFELHLEGFVLFPVIVKASIHIPFLSRQPGHPDHRKLLLLISLLSRDRCLPLMIICPHRGEWDIGVEQLRVQDIFGLFAFPLLRNRNTAGLKAHLTVYPAVTELVGETPPPPPTLEYAETSMVTADHGDSFSGTRQYRDGDSLKRIHWIQSIRTRQLYTRQYDTSAEESTMLLLDTLLPPGANPFGCADMMTDCAASLALFYIFRGYPIRLFCPWGNLDETAHDLDDFQPLYGDLAALPFSHQAVPFDTAILSPSVLGTQRALHILTYRLSHEMLEALRPLTAKRCRINCIIPPGLETPDLVQHALDVDVRLLSIQYPEDIAVKLGDCL